MRRLNEIMSMKHWRNDTDRRKPKYSKETSFKCHIFKKKKIPHGLTWPPQSEKLKGGCHLLDLGMDGRVMFIRLFSGRENMNCIHIGLDSVYFRGLVNLKMHMLVT